MGTIFFLLISIKIEAVLILINNTIKTPITNLKMASLSLNEQMTILQKQQTTLAEKIKQEEERKKTKREKYIKVNLKMSVMKKKLLLRY